MALKEKASKPVKIGYSGTEEAPKKKKKKSLDASASAEPKKKKKKKSTSTEIVVVEHTKKEKKLTVEKGKKKKAKLEAQIQLDLAAIEEMPMASSQEKEQLDEYLHMFRKLGKLIRKAEKQCMKSGQSRDYYALCTLMSQQREVIADIRSVSDMSGSVAQLDTNMLQPMIRSIGQNKLDAFYQIRKLMVATCKPEETQFALSKLDEITQEQAKHLQGQYQAATEKVHQIMMG